MGSDSGMLSVTPSMQSVGPWVPNNVMRNLIPINQVLSAPLGRGLFKGTFGWDGKADSYSEYVLVLISRNPFSCRVEGYVKGNLPPNGLLKGWCQSGTQLYSLFLTHQTFIHNNSWSGLNEGKPMLWPHGLHPRSHGRLHSHWAPVWTLGSQEQRPADKYWIGRPVQPVARHLS